MLAPEQFKIKTFALTQRIWVALRTCGRAMCGADRFDRIIDSMRLRDLKSRTWLSQRTMPDNNTIVYRPQDQCILEEIYDRNIYDGEQITIGQTIIDAGAHIGVFALMAARRVGPTGRVLAFEPSPHTAELTRRNIARNKLAWVKFYPVALAEAETTASFFISDDASSNPVTDTLHATAGRAQVHVRLRRLDDVLAEEGISIVDHLKIDVEGAELRVLDGAAHTLARTRRIMMEIHPPLVDPNEVQRRLEALSFVCRVTIKNGCTVLKAERRP